MHITLGEVFSGLIDSVDSPIVAVETGASSIWSLDNIKYLSTPNIIEHLVKPTGGILYCLDTDHSMIDICEFYVGEMGLSKYVKFIVGDSVESIKNLNVTDVNFVWLDSLEDGDHAMGEYEAIQPLLARKNIICVDDYGSQNSVKWQGISDIIVKTFDSFKTYDTPTGLIVGKRV